MGIKTADSEGILEDKVLFVDPTRTLQQGGIVETLKDEVENPVQINLNENEEIFNEMEEDKYGLESSIEKEEDRPDIPKIIHRRRCKICMEIVDDLKEHRKNVHSDPILNCIDVKPAGKSLNPSKKRRVTGKYTSHQVTSAPSVTCRLTATKRGGSMR